MMKNNAHLVYLTGLSMDKKRLNYITENINRDIDFIYWFDKTKDILSQSLKNDKSIIVNELDTSINLIKIITDTILKKEFSNNYETVKKYVHPILTDLLDAKKDEGNYEFSKTWFDNKEEFLENMQEMIETYHNGEFFSLYISHQSDSIGVAPLSKISASNNLTFLNAYCDRPYYANEYVNHIVLKIEKNSIKKEYQETFKEFIESNFYIHFLDTFLSKLLGDTTLSSSYIEKSKDEELAKAMEDKKKDNKIPDLSYYDMVINGGKTVKNLEDIQASLSERNFYGISLLNQIFYNLEGLLKDDSLEINVENNENSTKQEFLKELIFSATDPENISFSKNAKIEAKIFFSDGLRLTEKENSEDMKFSSFKVWDEIKLENIKLDTASDNSIDANYIYEDEKESCFYVKIPIKMALSLPLNEQGEVDSSLFIPYGIDSSEHKVVDVLTVGGAEHNRALSHLINKHRAEYKGKRLFGFMDNKYDLQNKVTYINDNEYEHSFLMGLNQPVSGYNAIFSARFDNDEGESQSLNTKLLGYRLKDGDSKVYNILSIYGFSALASVFGMHHIVSEIDNIVNALDKGNKELKEIFSECYLPALYTDIDNDEYINKGLSSLLLYPKVEEVNKQLKEQFDSKVPLYIFNNDIELFKKTFLLNKCSERLLLAKKNGRNTIEIKR